MWANLLSPPLPPDHPRFLRDLVNGNISVTSSRSDAEHWERKNRKYSSPLYADYQARLEVVMPFDDDTWAWICRERNRFDDGNYTRVPSLPYGSRYPEHFLHIAKDCKDDGPMMVAYTPNDAYGRKDRQIRVKPGRYLAQFYPELPNDARVEWASKVEAVREREKMKVTADSSEISRIYRSCGIRSCMDGSHDFSYLSDWPTSAYGAPGDLALAYLGTIDDPAARCVVWPEKKIHTSIYGVESNRLQNLLRAADYKRGNFDGARLRAIDAKYDGRSCLTFLMPYVDGAEYVTLSACARFLILNFENGGVSAKPTSGLIHWEDGIGISADVAETWECANCENEVDTEGALCDWCDENTFVCESCNRRHYDEDGRTSGDGEWFCQSCWANQRVTCDDCGDTYHPSENDGNTEYCSECSVRADCAECGASFKTTELDENDRCDDCPIEDESDDDEVEGEASTAIEVIAEGGTE